MSRSLHKSKVSYKVGIMAVVSFILVTILFLVCYSRQQRIYREEQKKTDSGELIVTLNEIDNLLTANYDSNNEINEDIHGKLSAVISALQGGGSVANNRDSKLLVIFYAVSMVSLLVIFVVIYVLILRPFDRLEDFAAEIAAGNLEKELKIDRVNMFGEFTWAFDHMRKEIKKSRQCEHEAIENNKTVIATLSHDIKTPIASIRAYAEGLSENMDSTPERRKRYTEVIMKKCDEVTKITDDMFLHSLHDLDKLIIKKEQVAIHKVIEETVESMQGSRGEIIIKDKIHEAALENADGDRIAQAIENIISNARKYANDSVVDLWTETDDKEYRLFIRDYGNGIPPEDMPFICNKFYRGKNSKNAAGSGLGLFIVNYIMEQMNGRLILENHTDGLTVELVFQR